MDLALGADEQRRADLDDQPRAGAGGEAVGFILQARLPSLRTTGASKRRPFDRLLSLVIVGHGVGRGAERLDQFVEHPRSEEHTSELQSLMRLSYAVFCLK